MVKHTSTILVVEDEIHIQDLLKLNLELEGYKVITTSLGNEAIEISKSRRIDLVILDVMLPDINGIEVCQKMKNIRSDRPILILSALGQSTDRIKGLKFGADDYLSKPFNLEELILRIEKLVGRFAPSLQESQGYQAGHIGNSIVDFKNFSITSNGKTHLLTAKEHELLKYMYDRKNTVLSRQEILEHIWGYEYYPSTRTIDNFISSFRKYIEEDPSVPKHFISIRGIGYKLCL